MLRATAELKRLQRNPLLLDSVEGFQQLMQRGKTSIDEMKFARRSIDSALNPLLMSGWQVEVLFSRIGKDPEAVYTKGFSQSEFMRRSRLLKLSYLGWWR